MALLTKKCLRIPRMGKKLVRVEEGGRAIFVSEFKQQVHQVKHLKTLVMKTFQKNQKWSMSLKATPMFTAENARPKIGDDDGISNRTLDVLIVLFTVIALCISIGSATANNDVKYRILLRQAMLDMDRLHYDKALIKLLEVRANTDENANVNQMLGICYLYGEKSAEKAAFYLSLAAPFASSEYEEWDLDEENASTKVNYDLARAYELLENYEKAAKCYGEFLATIQWAEKPSTSRMFAIISQRAELCKLAAAKQAESQQHQNVAVNN